LIGAMAAIGCSTPGLQTIHVAPAQFRSASSVMKPASARAGQAHAKRNAATLVEESLHARGIRFGTDGTLPALYAFLQSGAARVQPGEVRAGDVLFFDLGTGCADHTGVTEMVDSEGRISFREWRDGYTRHSYVTPRQPVVRRDARGRILNTFLRPKRQDDGPETRYFAGEMLCAAFRMESPTP
jgi:hypothetical protein